MSEQAEKIMAGAIEKGGKKVVGYVACWLLFGILAQYTGAYFAGQYDRDSTDGRERSNMRPHTDALTGCQYLSSIAGGITPRIDHKGAHLGCRRT